MLKETLCSLGCISEKNIEVFSTGTRDRPGLKVLRDRFTGVIFIDNFYVGDDEYLSGDYRNSCGAGRDYSIGYEDAADTRRRVASTERYVRGKTLVDFGCGSGNFLRAARCSAAKIAGVELQKDYVDQLKSDNITCAGDINDIDFEPDVVTMFHCLEHLPDPIAILSDIRKKIKKGGTFVVEVPHARDFLLTQIKSPAFKRHTLWSQHLLLHTRASLEAFLNTTGFTEITIGTCQRYGLTNHLNWISEGAPGGHKRPVSLIETPLLQSAYSDALSSIDSNDTLFAVCRAG